MSLRIVRLGTARLTVTPLHGHPDLLPQVCNWFSEEWPGWYGAGGRGQVQDDVTAMAASPDALPLGLVAWRDGQAVGIGALKSRSIASHGHLGPWAAAGYVVPARRRQGIGAVLLTALVAHAGRLGHARVYCATGTAVSLLTRCGWSALEEVLHDGQALTVFSHGTAKPPCAESAPVRVAADTRSKAR